MDPTESFGGTSGWMRDVGLSQVSHFAFSHLIGTDALNLEPFRFNLQAGASTACSMNPIGTFQGISGWLHGLGAYPVSFPIFWHLADLYRFRFDSSMSMSRPNASVQMLCMMDGWHRRHR